MSSSKRPYNLKLPTIETSNTLKQNTGKTYFELTSPTSLKDVQTADYRARASSIDDQLSDGPKTSISK